MKRKEMSNPDKPLTSAEFASMDWKYGFDGLAELMGEDFIVPLRGRPKSALRKSPVNIRLDADILETFKKTGKGWQTRLNSILRSAVEQGMLTSSLNS